MEPMNTILETIVQQKRREVEKLPVATVDAHRLRETLRTRESGLRDFCAALIQPRRGDIALIAEIKKASPSLGVICDDFDPVRIAREYEAAGASCLSVLTDEKFFQGSLENLRLVRKAVSLPLLRKDFIIDERQILEAVEWGADAILLIVSILSDDALLHFRKLAESVGIAALVEVHDEAELDRALRCGARLIGVNNRDLKSFQVDLRTTERLATRLNAQKHGNMAGAQPRHILVAESGIHRRADVERVKRCGSRAILVGESLMKSGNIAAKAAELIESGEEIGNQ